MGKCASRYRSMRAGGYRPGYMESGGMLVGFPSGVARETARKPSRGPRQIEVRVDLMFLAQKLILIMCQHFSLKSGAFRAMAHFRGTKPFCGYVPELEIKTLIYEGFSLVGTETHKVLSYAGKKYYIYPSFPCTADLFYIRVRIFVCFCANASRDPESREKHWHRKKNALCHEKRQSG